MKKTGLKLAVLLLILFCFTSLGWSMDLPDYSGDIYVQDFANMISSQLEEDIKSVARSLEAQTSAQIAVVTINSLDGNDIEGYTNELFRKWQLGAKEQDNGALLLIAKEDQRFRIEVGYGLEGRINDAKAGDILREMAPYFQEGNFNKGIALAFNTLVREISAEYEIEPVQISENQLSERNERTTTGPEEKSFPLWAKVLFVLVFIYLAIFHPDVLMQLIYIFMRSGGRGGGGSGGGGFRGGGGGSSGGGGASGRW